MYALVDGNNFYASCERVFRPDLQGIPIVILSNNDGVIIARSNEAKALGIPMGLPYFKSKNLILKHKIKIFSSNYALYGDMSNRMMNIMKMFTPDVEIYSVDEAFLKFKGFKNYDLNAYGQKIQKTILKSTGLPTSIGIAKTKSLAKVANKIAKKFPDRTKSVYYIDNEEKRIKALRWTKISDVWGIGRKHSKRLQAVGVENAYQFTQMSDTWVRKHMSIVGLRLKKDLLGESIIQFEEIRNKQSIATTRSFDKTYTEFKDLRERISTFAFSCAEKLRQQKSQANAIMIFIQTNGYKNSQAQYSKSIVVKLPFATNSSIDLVKYAVNGLNRIFKKEYQYKKAGVIVMDLCQEFPDQLNLFEDKNPKHKKLMQTIDQLNLDYGRHTVKLASQDLNKMWKMKQENLSQRYSTDLNEIIIVNTK